MQYWGETISLVVALSWTATALCADIASHKLGAQPLNLIRMGLSLVCLVVFLWVLTGSPMPIGTDGKTWFWLALSGLVGYVFGDYCLFNSYVVFGSKFGQLFMTIAPPTAGVAGWLFLGERMDGHAWLAMAVTLSGIAMSILGKDKRDTNHRLRLRLKLPIKGVMFGIGAGVGQGLGLVLSKQGLDTYATALPVGVSEEVVFAMPFAGTFIRAIFGFMGFFVLLVCSGKMDRVGCALKDRNGMTFAFLTTLFGPFIGVSLSLMAVQHTQAGIASTLMALTPVLIIFPYALVYRQKIKPMEFVGALVTVCGVAMFFLL